MGPVPVVLVHGVRTSRTMWRAQVELLAAAGYPAVAVDLPGHGLRRAERFTLAGADGVVAAAVDGLGGRALVVGLSLGGYVAIAHAARHPAQVAGLVAAGCSTRPAPLLLDGWALAARGIARLPDAGAGLNQFMVKHTLPVAPAADVAAGGFALDVMADVLRELRPVTPLADLARVRAPVWIVNGRLDHFRADERRYLTACRDGRLIVLRGARHLVPLDAPVAFGRVLLRALAELADDPRPPGRPAGSAGSATAQAPGPNPPDDPGRVGHHHDVVPEPREHHRGDLTRVAATEVEPVPAEHRAQPIHHPAHPA